MICILLRVDLVIRIHQIILRWIPYPISWIGTSGVLWDFWILVQRFDWSLSFIMFEIVKEGLYPWRRIQTRRILLVRINVFGLIVKWLVIIADPLFEIKFK